MEFWTDPQATLPTEKDELSYVDCRDVDINVLSLNDLVALGLLHDHLEITATSIHDWSTDPKKKDHVLVPNVGRLVLEEMASPSPGNEKSCAGRGFRFTVPLVC